MPAESSSLAQQAHAALEEGRLPDAVHLHEQALKAPLAPEARARVLEGLALAYGRSGRFFECSVVARGLVSRLEQEDADTPRRLRGLAILVGALINAEAPRRALPYLEQLEALLPTLPVDAATASTRRLAFQARYSVSLLDEALEQAEASLDGIRDLLDRDLLQPCEAVLLRHGEFHLLMARRDIRAMEALLSELTHAEDPHNVYVPEITIRSGLAVARAERGDLEEARSHVRHVLEWIRAHEAAGSASDTVLGDASTLVALCARELGDIEGARELAGLLTRAVLERLRAVDASARTLEGLIGAQEEGLLEEMREDFMTAHVSFLRGLRDRIAMPPPREVGGVSLRALPADDEPLEEEMLRVCAWCGSVNLALDQWVPLKSFVPGGPVPRVTHGICPRCMPVHWDWNAGVHD